MKRLFYSILLIAVDCENPIISPMLSMYSCDSQTISVMFETALQPKENTQYYVYANKVFPKDCNIILNFDSKANITFIVKRENNKYMRMVLPEGDTFSLNLVKQHSGLGFIVKGIKRGVTPYILNFLVNDEELCNDPVLGFIEKYAAYTDITDANTCGRRTVDNTELITIGATIKPGDWPWHAAIYRSITPYRTDRSSVKYTCGGTLVSKKAVLTAAHCTTYRGVKYPSETLIVVLGKYYLSLNDKGTSVEKGVQKIIVHEDFKYQHLVNDIALLILKTEVTFNDYIRPACLWDSGLEKSLISNPIYGTVVGWSLDMTGSLSNTLRKVTMPLVNEATCLRSNPVFYSRALNGFTFCAGYPNGTSVCNGDSGSAFQVFIPDEIQIGTSKSSGTWHVRGIVSTSLSRHDAPICDPNQYGVFTDVAKYADWIKNHWED